MRGPSELNPTASSSHGSTGGPRWVPPAAEEVAPLLPNYQVLSLLGRGGMGAVYLALQTSLDRSVAIKLLPLEVSADEAFAQRFVREARAMARLSHPHITAVHDFGKTGEGHLYFVMEFVDGANLASMIHGPGLQPAQALAIAGQVCEALAYAHAQGIVHRDIKPANVLVDRNGQLKVSDFGIARIAEPGAGAFTATQTGVVVGTPDYMAPEQMRGTPVDHRADIYSLGVMLYEMLCGEVPRGVFALPSERVECDARVDAVVLKAMQQKPDLRYQNTTEMRAALETARTPLPRKPRRNFRFPHYAGFVLALAAMVASALYFIQPEKRPRGTKRIEEKAALPAAPSPRATAEWLFRVGDRESYIRLRKAGSLDEITIKSVAEMPAGEWEIVELWIDRGQAPPDLPPATREDFIAHTSGLTKLRYLFVRMVALHDADLAFLANNPDIQTLRLEGVPVGDAVLVHLSGLKKIRTLDISGTPAFTGRGLEKLACLPVLDDLVVCGTGFTNDAARALTACPKLRVAQIAQTAVTDESLRALKSLPALEEVYLDRNAITDAGLAEIAQAPVLNKLLLVDVPVTDAAVAAFRKARPECTVVRTVH